MSKLPVSKQFGQNLKRLRLKKSLSQGDISRRLDVDRSYVSNLENGRMNPTLSTIKKLAKALNTSADKLLKRV
ncbi:MAG: helix-turn-helix transcriptional regulator [Candidatus Pacebacteria bacterium]|nr:helix-turn-helix transcriptional regulator [Candidatus Paceibacterota bacterium]